MRSLVYAVRLQPRKPAMPPEASSSLRFSAGWCTFIRSNKSRKIFGPSNGKPTTTRINRCSIFFVNKQFLRSLLSTVLRPAQFLRQILPLEAQSAHDRPRLRPHSLAWDKPRGLVPPPLALRGRRNSVLLQTAVSSSYRQRTLP